MQHIASARAQRPMLAPKAQQRAGVLQHRIGLRFLHIDRKRSMRGVHGQPRSRRTESCVRRRLPPRHGRSAAIAAGVQGPVGQAKRVLQVFEGQRALRQAQLLPLVDEERAAQGHQQRHPRQGIKARAAVTPRLGIRVGHGGPRLTAEGKGGNPFPTPAGSHTRRIMVRERPRRPARLLGSAIRCRITIRATATGIMMRTRPKAPRHRSAPRFQLPCHGRRIGPISEEGERIGGVQCPCTARVIQHRVQGIGATDFAHRHAVGVGVHQGPHAAQEGQ